MSSLTNEALASVIRHCPNLTSLYISMHRYITGTSLLPLLREPERAVKLRHLNLSCKFVRGFITAGVDPGLTRGQTMASAECEPITGI